MMFTMVKKYVIFSVSNIIHSPYLVPNFKKPIMFRLWESFGPKLIFLNCTVHTSFLYFISCHTILNKESIYLNVLYKIKLINQKTLENYSYLIIFHIQSLTQILTNSYDPILPPSV